MSFLIFIKTKAGTEQRDNYDHSLAWQQVEKNKSSQCYQVLKGNNGACQFLLSVGTDFDEKAQLHKRGKGYDSYRDRW